MNLEYLVQRLSEPSTYATLASVLVLAHVNVDPGVWQNVVDAGIALSALAGAILKEGAPKS